LAGKSWSKGDQIRLEHGLEKLGAHGTNFEATTSSTTVTAPTGIMAAARGGVLDGNE
jgi:hypothetical protein